MKSPTILHTFFKKAQLRDCVVEHFWCTGAVLNEMPRVKYVHTLSVLTAIFQVNLGYPVFIEAKDDGSGGDIWTNGAISHAKLQSNHHHQQTNIQFFTGRMSFLSQTNSAGMHCPSWDDAFASSFEYH